MDRGILLKDVLESNVNDSINFDNRPESSCKRIIRKISNNKSRTITASSWKGIESDGMSIVAEPVCVAQRGRMSNGKWQQQFEPRFDGKTNTITTVTKDNLVGEPIQIEAEKLSEQYYHGNKNTNVFGKIECKNTSDNNGQPAQGTRIYRTDRKFICLDADSRKYIIDQYKDNFVDLNGKDISIYEVKNGYITIKDKQYPIKLDDGYYIIRKLTPIECERLQTLPDNYTAGISNSQRYKCIGNGWTAEVIIHILKHMNIPLDEEIQVLSMYDGIATGRYCFDKLGYKNVQYHAYEIDKYAMQVAMKNYPNIIQYGDAFQVREDNWKLNY